MLLNFVVHNPRGDLNAHHPLYACTASNETGFGNSNIQVSNLSNSPRYTKETAQMETAWRGDDTSQYSSHAQATVQLVQAQMNLPESQNTTIALGYSNGVALGSLFWLHDG